LFPGIQGEQPHAECDRCVTPKLLLQWNCTPVWELWRWKALCMACHSPSSSD